MLWKYPLLLYANNHNNGAGSVPPTAGQVRSYTRYQVINNEVTKHKEQYLAIHRLISNASFIRQDTGTLRLKQGVNM